VGVYLRVSASRCSSAPSVTSSASPRIWMKRAVLSGVDDEQADLRVGQQVATLLPLERGVDPGARAVDRDPEMIGVDVDIAITAKDARSHKPAHGNRERFAERVGADRRHHVHVGPSIFADLSRCADLGITRCGSTDCRASPPQRGPQSCPICRSYLPRSTSSCRPTGNRDRPEVAHAHGLADRPVRSVARRTGASGSPGVVGRQARQAHV
jgi:hypothetical protein